MIKMLEDYCHYYILLKQKQTLLRLLWIYDINNIDLQTELLKVDYELKECEIKMGSVVNAT